MKKLIIALLITATLLALLASCTGNGSGNGSDTTDTKNPGKVTETGSDTNIIDRVESGMDDIESDILGTN